MDFFFHGWILLISLLDSLRHGNGSDTAIELFKGFTLKTITPDEILFANISH